MVTSVGAIIFDNNNILLNKDNNILTIWDLQNDKVEKN